MVYRIGGGIEVSTVLLFLGSINEILNKVNVSQQEV
jgi:hypothetical protein